jgi:hypothetical protein
MFSLKRFLMVGLDLSEVFCGKLNILDNLLHLVHLFYTSNLKVWFSLYVNAARLLNSTSVELPKSYWYDLCNSYN